VISAEQLGPEAAVWVARQRSELGHVLMMGFPNDKMDHGYCLTLEPKQSTVEIGAQRIVRLRDAGPKGERLDVLDLAAKTNDYSEAAAVVAAIQKRR
jgi:hypothetical protein